MNTQTQLASARFARLADEETTLADALTALRGVRTALISRDPAVLEAAVDQQARVAAQLTLVQERRRQFRQSVVAWSALAPEDITLSGLAPDLAPAERAMVLSGRQRLRDLAVQVQTHARLVGALAGDFLAVLHQVFLDLAGAQGDAKLYGPAGALPTIASGALVQAQG